MGTPPPWYEGLVNYQIDNWCCTGDCPNNGNWNRAYCNENAAIRLLYTVIVHHGRKIYQTVGIEIQVVSHGKSFLMV